MIAGVPWSHMPVSQTRATSALSSSRFAATKAGRFGEPDSSSPSIIRVMPTGSSPATAIQARQASMKVITWPLSSQAPRALMTLRPSFSVAMRGSNGGVSHRSTGSTGCTS